MSIHEQLVACIARADEAARAKEYRKVLLALDHAEFKAALLAAPVKEKVCLPATA